MNSNDHPELFSETWDPTHHTRLYFPVLEHPDARPEQAPSQGVRQLLYQYEAAQSVSTAPLHIFWNDEENNNHQEQQSLNSDGQDMDAILRELRGEDEQRTRFTALTLVACLVVLCSVSAIIVATICRFGTCGKRSGGDYYHGWEENETTTTKVPTASPPHSTGKPIRTRNPDPAITIIWTTSPTPAPSWSSNIFKPPATPVPSIDAPVFLVFNNNTNSTLNLSNTTATNSTNATLPTTNDNATMPTLNVTNATMAPTTVVNETNQSSLNLFTAAAETTITSKLP